MIQQIRGIETHVEIEFATQPKSSDEGCVQAEFARPGDGVARGSAPLSSGRDGVRGDV
jgi:hypothetical protein